jgi:CHAT domain
MTNFNFNISGSSINNLAGSGDIHYQEAAAENRNVNISTGEPSTDTSEASDHPVKTILILAANPKGTAALRLNEEMREIEAGLQRSQKRDQFVLKYKLAARLKDIEQALLDYKPQIIHFSGHGEGEEGLVLEDDLGQPHLLDANTLAAFQIFAERVECVVLNACYSTVQAELIAQHVPYVVGMNKAIGDKAAIAFAVGFYDAIAAGESYEFAYKLGCSLVRMQGITEYLTPQLLKKPA